MKNDAEIVKEVQKGDLNQFSELVRRHQKLMLKVAFRVTRDLGLAEDVVQESFVKAYRKIGTFEGRSSFRSWLYQVTLNTAKNKLRSIKKNTTSMEFIDIGVRSVAEKRMVEEDLRSIMKEAVDELPARQKQAIELRVYFDLSFKEVAEAMGCPYDTAKANYRHGLMKIKGQLEKDALLREWHQTGAEELWGLEGRLLEGEI